MPFPKSNPSVCPTWPWNIRRMTETKRTPAIRLGKAFQVLDAIDGLTTTSDRQPAATVQIGSLVRLLEPDTGVVFSIRLVRHERADRQSQRISILSPLGSALLGAVAGDRIEVQLIHRTAEYVVLDVTSPAIASVPVARPGPLQQPTNH